MIKHVFAIHDSKAKFCIIQFFADNAEIAKRDFTEVVNAEGSPINRFPGDYTLFEVGTFDQNKIKMIPHVPPINHGLAITFVNPIPHIPADTHTADFKTEHGGNK